jgi:hypothetical protein
MWVFIFSWNNKLGDIFDFACLCARDNKFWLQICVQLIYGAFFY